MESKVPLGCVHSRTVSIVKPTWRFVALLPPINGLEHIIPGNPGGSTSQATAPIDGMDQTVLLS